MKYSVNYRLQMEAKTRQKYYSEYLRKNQQLVLQSNLSNADTEGKERSDLIRVACPLSLSPIPLPFFPLSLSPIPLPFFPSSLSPIPYPLPLSTPATQAIIREVSV